MVRRRRRAVAPTPGGAGAGRAAKRPDIPGALPAILRHAGAGHHLHRLPVPPDDVAGSQVPADDKPGWFVVLQQQETELRFGLDVTAPAALTGTWRDLQWGNVTLTASGHIDLSTPLAGINVTAQGLEWAKTSAHIAAIITQTWSGAPVASSPRR